MLNTAEDWRDARRQSARAAILEAAWELVAERGLAGLSLRDLAHQVGASVPTVYKYFPSKNDIYDAMFGDAAAQFEQRSTAPYPTADPKGTLLEGLRRFFEFCTENVPRYQLLFQRTIPGFEPSPDAYEPAVRALEEVRGRLAHSGVTDPRHVDLWTALTTGLVDQQISNDPGGRRWSRLADQAVSMFLAHCQATAPTSRRRRK